MTQMRTPRLRDTRTWKSRSVTCGCPLVFTFPGSLGGLCGRLGMSGRWGGCPWHLCLIPQLSLECAQDVIQLLVHLHDLLGNQRAEELSDGCKCCWWEAFWGQKQGKSLAGSMGIWEPPTPWVLSSLLLWSRWHCKVTGTMAGEEQDIAGPRTQFKHFVSAFSQGWWWCILQISALKLSFTLRFIVNVFFPVPLPALTTLACRTSCFPLLSWEMEQPPLPSHCK